MGVRGGGGCEGGVVGWFCLFVYLCVCVCVLCLFVCLLGFVVVVCLFILLIILILIIIILFYFLIILFSPRNAIVIRWCNYRV